MKKQTILVIPDIHAPYEHPDTLAFLKAVKRKFKPTEVVCLGDEVDNHAISFHDSDADLFSAGDELKEAIKFLKQLERIFPKMTIVDSNHGSLAVRRFKSGGIPLKYMKSLNDVYGIKGWKWVNDYTVKLINGTDCYFAHGITKDGRKLAQQRAVNVVQGHFHTEFRIDYVSNPADLLFSMQCGCLIDKKSMAFAYDKLNLQRPVLGCGVIVNGIPQLIPMILNSKGRWTNKI